MVKETLMQANTGKNSCRELAGDPWSSAQLTNIPSVHRNLDGCLPRRNNGDLLPGILRRGRHRRGRIRGVLLHLPGNLDGLFDVQH